MKNRVESIGFGKSLPGHPDSNFMTRIKFAEKAPMAVVTALANVLAGAHPVEVDHDGKRVTVRTNGMDGDTKMRLAKQALHRVGFQRFDEAFMQHPVGSELPAEFQERLSMLFGVDAERFGFKISVD